MYSEQTSVISLVEEKIHRHTDDLRKLEQRFGEESGKNWRARSAATLGFLTKEIDIHNALINELQAVVAVLRGGAA